MCGREEGDGSDGGMSTEVWLERVRVAGSGLVSRRVSILGEVEEEVLMVVERILGV